MTVGWQQELKPGVALREIVGQATAALVAMDAEHLEELARCCADLNREIERNGEAEQTALTLGEAGNEMKLLGRVLYETRANLTVLTRLHAIRIREAMVAASRIHLDGSPGKRQAASTPLLAWGEKGADYGNN